MSEKAREQKRKLYESRFRERYKDSKSTILLYTPGSRKFSTKPRVKFICHLCEQESEIVYASRRKKDDLICMLCLQRMKAKQSEGTTFTTSFVKDKLKEAGVTPTFKEYTNAQTPLTFICNCGQEGKITWSNFHYHNSTPRCSTCHTKARTLQGKEAAKFLPHQPKIYTTETVKFLFIQHGATPLFEVYLKQRQRLPYKCSCGKESFTTLESFNSHRQRADFKLLCQSCACLESQAKVKGDYERDVIRPFFIKNGCTPLFKSYSSATQMLEFTCICGNKDFFIWGSHHANGTIPRCRECQIKSRPRGKEHHMWNPDLTEEERQKGRPNLFRVWSAFILEFGAYTCCISKQKGGKLSVHHLKSWSKNPIDRFNILNAVILRKELHEEFHIKYDSFKGTATTQDFLEFFKTKTGRNLELKRKIFIEIVRGSEHILNLKKEFASQQKEYYPIFEHEIRFKREIIKSFINFKLNFNIKKVFARNLEVSFDLTKNEVQDFLKKNHRQGFCGGKIRVALKRGGEIFCLMVLGRDRFRNNQYELLRFCSKLNHSVVGGASRLFKHFIKRYQPDSVTSYCDKRFSSYDSGNTMYIELGFRFLHNSSPNYWYTRDYLEFYSRLNFQKHLLKDKLINFNSELTEAQNMAQNGFLKIQDCGNQVFEWVSPEVNFTHP